MNDTLSNNLINLLTPEQQEIRNAVLKLCARFGDDYWLARDRDGEFPWEFRKALAESGFLGISLPEAYGGGGCGLTEGMLMMQAIAESGAGFSGGTAVGFGVWAPRILVNFASEEQKERWLPPIIRGEILSSFSVTEPDAGLDTTNITTFARRDGDRYIVNGRKAWCSVAQRASKVLLLTRTSPRDPARPTEGLTLFYTDLDRSRVEVREIEKMGRKCVDSNLLFIDDLEIPVEDRVGEEGKAFRYLLMGLNPERIMMAGQAIGLGRAALAKATQYARDRVVFGRPIGQNQSIQHPLAVNWMQLEAAQLMTLRAAALYDAGQSCGAEANAAKFLAAEAGFEACSRAILTHGGMGYAKEYHVERYLREVMIPRIAPVSAEMVKNFIAEKVLDLPKSY